MAVSGPFDDILSAAHEVDLEVLGTVHPERTAVDGLSDGTLILLGLRGAEGWRRISSASEFHDGQHDPLDRWSRRIIGGLATMIGAQTYYPFGGPPYMPFVNWALASGRAFTSPSHMLVHDTVGMLISYRGALHLRQEIKTPAPALHRSPCDSCETRACLNSCPVHAMVDGGPYGLSACRTHLATPAGAPCLSNGCIARIACPLSRGADRDPQQSAHHMSYFHKT